MRHIATGILLSLSVSALASVQDDLSNNLTPQQAMENAAASCGDNGGCLESAIQDMIAAGVDIATVATVAEASGASLTQIISAATAQGVSGADAVQAAASTPSGQDLRAVLVAADTAGVAQTDAVQGAINTGASSSQVMSAAIQARFSPENFIAAITQAETGATGAGNQDGGQQGNQDNQQDQGNQQNNQQQSNQNNGQPQVTVSPI